MKVILESQFEAHDPALYAASEVFTEPRESSLEAQYESCGFVVARQIYAPEEVQAAREELRAMVHSDEPGCDSLFLEGTIRTHLNDGDGRRALGENPSFDDLALGNTSDCLPDLPRALRAKYVRKFMGFTDRHAPLRRLAEKPELITVIEKLAQAPVRLFQDMAMIKPPGGREKPWHQDHAYFNYPLETRVVGVWIALDQVTTENGCMHVLSGGHRDGARAHFMRRDWQLCDGDMLRTSCTAIPMDAGDALLFSAKLPHGTPTNQTSDFRWAIQLHYVPIGTETEPEAVRLANFGSEGKNVSC